MRNLNEEARKLREDVLEKIKDPEIRRTWESFREPLIPEHHVATSIGDFLDNADSIKLNYWVFLKNPFFYGTAIIYLHCPVNFSFSGGSYGTISDRTGSLEFKLNMFPFEKKRLQDGAIFYSTTLRYNPTDKKSWLLSYEDQGPAQGEGYKSPFLIPMLNPE